MEQMLKEPIVQLFSFWWLQKRICLFFRFHVTEYFSASSFEKLDVIDCFPQALSTGNIPAFLPWEIC